MPAITAVRAAAFYVFFTTKPQAAMAAVAGQYSDGCLVDEFHDSILTFYNSNLLKRITPR